MDKNLKVGVLIVAIVLIVLGINYFSGGDIKEANINGYVFLEEVSKCDVIYAIDISKGGLIAQFKEGCFEDAAKNLKDILLEPGKTGEKFILESEEYLGCAEINNLKGNEAYRNCIKEILPILEEKYFGFVED